MKKGYLLRRSAEALAAMVIVISVVVYSFAIISGITDSNRNGQVLAGNEALQGEDSSSAEVLQNPVYTLLNPTEETRVVTDNSAGGSELSAVSTASADQGETASAPAQALNSSPSQAADISAQASNTAGAAVTAADENLSNTSINSLEASNYSTAAVIAAASGEKTALELKAREPVFKYVAVDKVNLRSGAGSDTEKLDTLYQGSRMQVLGQADQWLEVITSDNRKGYVYAEYTADTKPPVYRYVSVDKVNLRSGAGSDTEKLDTLYQGARIQVLEVLDQWINIVTSDNLEGYVYAEYTSDKAPVIYKYVNSETLNLRKGPDAETTKLATLQAGDKVQFLETKGEWSRIKTSKDVEGYVKTKYVVNSQKQVVSRAAATSTTPAPHNADLATQVLEYAKQFVGVKYVYGAKSPKGFDCSGFTQYVFEHFGIEVPRSAAEYSSIGTKISRKDIKPGDLVLLDRYWNNELGHVGIYMGNDKFIHASSKKGKIVIASLSEYSGNLMGIRRVLK